ncbi:MAG: type II toxin-antitoxin system PemK/MazF family toxin [Candidatus Methanomethylophilaceae archaeon]|nr:type II toxin-antitoxin system PemK/MazF family toxin [Candidatus Methanomethylophilaceae archaeon]
MKEKWSIWWAEVFFEDDPDVSKIRPVVILEDRIAVCVSLKVTSKVHNDATHVILEQWESAGLTSPSWVDMSRVLNIPESCFKEKIGTLDQCDILSILRRLGTMSIDKDPA